MTTNQRYRAWCMTINNPTTEEVEFLENIECRYLIVGDEVGEEGTPHLQIYIYFVNGRTFNRMKRDFPRAHIEVARGSPEENREYCSKENVMIERGNIPTQGRRSDIIAYIELVKSGRTDRS